MDMTCRCKGAYTCVACKVKRGDYKDWMLVETPGVYATTEHRVAWALHQAKLQQARLQRLGRSA